MVGRKIIYPKQEKDRLGDQSKKNEGVSPSTVFFKILGVDPLGIRNQ